MVTIYRQPDWKIGVYGREHGLPHFHIECPGFRCSIDIETLDVIVGMVPDAVLKEVVPGPK
jgi:hypothetical protein